MQEEEADCPRNRNLLWTVRWMLVSSFQWNSVLIGTFHYCSALITRCLAVTGCTRSLLSKPSFGVGREKSDGTPKNFFDFFFQYLDCWDKKNDRSRRQIWRPPKNGRFSIFFHPFAKFECQIWFGVIRWSYQYSVLEDSYYFGLKRIFEENKFFVRALEMAVSAGINCFFDLTTLGSTARKNGGYIRNSNF